MIIKEAIAELELKGNPVAKLMHTGVAFKVIVLAFKKDMILKEHKTSVPTKLTVLTGNVKYSSENLIRTIDTYEELEIPIEEIHSIEALGDSLCLLIQGYRN
jgi:quercetin dioxygenase-like cupin family protein